MNRTSLVALALVSSLPVAATSFSPAAAAPARPLPAPLTNYVQVVSPLTPVPSGATVRLDVTCPTGTKVVGGGALVLGTSLAGSVNTSAPVFDGRRWRVAVNNVGSVFDNAFRAYAICVSGITDYHVVEGLGIDNPRGTQTTADASCPAGTVPLGGGGAPIESVTSVALNSSYPLTDGWRVRVNNTGTAGDFVSPYVVCGKAPSGYQRVVGPATTPKPQTQGQAAVACPVGAVALSGGARSALNNRLVSVNSSAPTDGRTWQTFENNGSGVIHPLTPYVTCAALQ